VTCFSASLSADAVAVAVAVVFFVRFFTVSVSSDFFGDRKNSLVF